MNIDTIKQKQWDFGKDCNPYWNCKFSNKDVTYKWGFNTIKNIFVSYNENSRQ